jgi:signal peptidase I
MTQINGPAGPTPPEPVPTPSESAYTPSEPAPLPNAETPDGPPPTAPFVSLERPDAAPNEPRRGAHRVESPWRRIAARRAEKKQQKAGKPHRKAPWWELPALVALAIGIAILVKSFIVQPFYIPSESMELTLHGSTKYGHDRILVNKLIYDFRDPHPGDIVVFHAPPGWDDEPASTPPSNPLLRVVRGFGQLVGVVPPDGQVLVKRVIATGGQRVWGVNVNGRSQVHVRETNGHVKVLSEPFVFNDGPDQRAEFGPVTVPKGRLWVMGDHRNDSADSRFHCGSGGGDAAFASSCNPNTSTVPIGDVIGKAFVVAWPPSHWRTLGTPSTFESAALAGASDVPGLVLGTIVVPLFAVRRRRRRG